MITEKLSALIKELESRDLNHAIFLNKLTAYDATTDDLDKACLNYLTELNIRPNGQPWVYMAQPSKSLYNLLQVYSSNLHSYVLILHGGRGDKLLSNVLATNNLDIAVTKAVKLTGLYTDKSVINNLSAVEEIIKTCNHFIAVESNSTNPDKVNREALKYWVTIHQLKEFNVTIIYTQIESMYYFLSQYIEHLKRFVDNYFDHHQTAVLYGEQLLASTPYPSPIADLIKRLIKE